MLQVGPFVVLSVACTRISSSRPNHMEDLLLISLELSKVL